MNIDTSIPRVQALHLSDQELSGLSKFTSYIWWQDAERTIRRPDCLIAQVMNLGRHNDVCDLEELLGDERLLYILQHAEPGEFCKRSWNYWHYRLTGVELGEVPPMPKRNFL
ncbi:hypothetical protein [uncultured Mailhella sp.]|uniref:hypothetical protein n=1 Tax=uncultured Mailhella sp. TaxID=1981031 RepID=UPI00260F0597|nr:hypothetical protein [uncultured Mailhella sp.]